VLRDPRDAGRPTPIPRAEIAELQPSDQSLMPAGLVNVLPAASSFSTSSATFARSRPAAPPRRSNCSPTPPCTPPPPSPITNRNSTTAPSSPVGTNNLSPGGRRFTTASAATVTALPPSPARFPPRSSSLRENSGMGPNPSRCTKPSPAGSA
jgi:hypothetical protein